MKAIPVMNKRENVVVHFDFAGDDRFVGVGSNDSHHAGSIAQYC